jgi:hypothetical protein
VLVPIVAQLIIQIGPVYLASRPKFDDLMDGLTFGVISGVSYATFDTLVRHSSALFGGFGGDHDAASWVALIFLEGLIKPLIMGTAAGIAAAEFSGLGRGYDGFTLRYARGLAEAILANIAYQVGAYLFSFLPPSQGIVVTLLWGLLILGVLILRVRTVLHAGLMEAALEHAARRDPAIGAAGELEFCAACEMPLVAGAAFCNNCGTAVRVAPHTGRPGRGLQAPPAGPSATAPSATAPSATGTSPSRGAVATAEPDTTAPTVPTRPAATSPSGPSDAPAHPSSQATPERPRRGTGPTERGEQA